MMKSYFLAITLVISLNSISEEPSNFSEKRKIEYLKNQISLILPEESSIVSIEKSEFPGIYKVFYGDIQPIYVSEEGTYFIYGNMFKINSKNIMTGGNEFGAAYTNYPVIENITDLDVAKRRLSLMKDIEKDSLISFESQDQVFDITVFTDVDCGYCRKLHKQIKEYNDLGISVRYAAFPRSGLGTDTFTKMVGAWCSDDTKTVLTSLKDGKEPKLKFCESQPVAKHYAIGKQLGITGTPAIITSKGELLPGYYSPEDLLNKLKG